MDTTAPAPRPATDAELLAAFDRGIAAGDFTVVDDDFLATLKAEIDAEEAAEEAAAPAPRYDITGHIRPAAEDMEVVIELADGVTMQGFVGAAGYPISSVTGRRVDPYAPGIVRIYAA
jgi:hypothetical protein